MKSLFKGTLILTMMTLVMGFSAPALQAQGKSDKSAMKDVVTKELNQKTKLVGTFDLYDESTKAVRNLRMISVGEPVEDKDGVRVPVNFRDNATGDTVIVDAQLEGSKVTAWKISKVEAAPQVETKESYTDEEIRTAIDAYLTQQTKFTEHLLFFDPKIENMRKLELVDFKKDYRHFGILTIETADFKDLDTGETLTMDIHVKVKKGLLEVESMKIKKIKKSAAPAAAAPAAAPAESKT